MRKTTRSIIWVLALVFISQLGFAQDTTWVQTFTFDDITKRQGEYEFPSGEEEYRKILMYYTLKCDGATTADEHPCGEWDYTTYTKLYHKLGSDSTYVTHPSFLVDGDSIDNFSFVSLPMYNYYQKVQDYRAVTDVANQITAEIGTGAKENGQFFNTDFTTRTSHMLIKADELTAAGLKAGNIEELKLNIAETGVGLNNLKIAMAHSTLTELSALASEEFTPCYHRNTEFEAAGWNTITLTSPFKWDGTSNLLIQFSIANYSTGKSTLVKADEVSFNATVSSPLNDKYFTTNDGNGKVSCGNIKELNNAESFTVEQWFKATDWVAWKNVWGKGEFPGGRIKLCLQTGPGEGQFFMIMRTGVDGTGTNNNHAYTARNAFKLNEWVHVAVVFDGNGTGNAGKIKIYLNGENMPMTYVHNIPDYTDNNSDPLELNMKGGFNFDTDNFRVWSKPLSAEEVIESMNNEMNTEHSAKEYAVADYSFNNRIGHIVPNLASSKYPASLMNNANVPLFATKDLFKGITPSTNRPQIQLLQGEYTAQAKQETVIDSVLQEAATVEEYVVGDHAFDISKVYQAWTPGKETLYNASNEMVEEYTKEADKTLEKQTLSTYTQPFEAVDVYEIGRFITPYGINLDLGDNGFTWIYDVTDYEPFLHNLVELSAGNRQELLDLKFAFIKGTPAREVLKVEKVWSDVKALKYSALDNDEVLAKKSIDVLPETKSAMLRARLTGHGHESSNGQYPHCCEWKDNTHYIYANDKLASEWKIWQTYDCGMNPVYPQGGTWPGAREGWCPGDKVKTHDIELSEYIGGSVINLDYDITDVPADNEGMGKGFYDVSMQLFQYGEANFTNDAELLDLIAPSDFGYHARKNPVCNNARVVLRNGGSEKLVSVNFVYSVAGGKEETFNWTGELDFMESTEVELPISDSKFWLGNESNVFTVSLENPNNKADENADNNTLSTNYVLPDFYNQEIIFKLRAASKYSEYMSYRILNQAGEVVKEVKPLKDSEVYSDTLKGLVGCYTYEIIDEMVFGLDYWAVQGLTAGSITIRDKDDKLLKAFEPNFGYKLSYSFAFDDVTYIHDNGLEGDLKLYPNPGNGNITLSANNFDDTMEVNVFNTNGKSVFQKTLNGSTYSEHLLNLSNLEQGVYFIQINDSKQVKTIRYIME